MRVSVAAMGRFPSVGLALGGKLAVSWACDHGEESREALLPGGVAHHSPEQLRCDGDGYARYLGTSRPY